MCACSVELVEGWIGTLVDGAYREREDGKLGCYDGTDLDNIQGHEDKREGDKLISC